MHVALNKLLLIILGAILASGTAQKSMAAADPAGRPHPPNPVTGSWNGNWNADLTTAAAGCVKPAPAPESVPGTTALVFFDKPSARQEVARTLAPARAEHHKAR